MLFCAFLNLIITVHVRRRNVKPIYKKNLKVCHFLKGIDVYNFTFFKSNYRCYSKKSICFSYKQFISKESIFYELIFFKLIWCRERVITTFKWQALHIQRLQVVVWSPALTFLPSWKLVWNYLKAGVSEENMVLGSFLGHFSSVLLDCVSKTKQLRSVLGKFLRSYYLLRYFNFKN